LAATGWFWPKSAFRKRRPEQFGFGIFPQSRMVLKHAIKDIDDRSLWYRKGGQEYCSVGDPWNNIEAALNTPRKFVTDSDLAILRLLWAQRQRANHHYFELRGSLGTGVLERIVARGRLIVQNADGGKSLCRVWAPRGRRS
jgi:hypothetical protein